MTVFPDGTKEPLHGHNYQVEVEIELEERPFAEMISFANLKTPLRALTKTWDEKFLLAKLNPFLKIRKHDAQELEFLLCGKRYVIPTDEVQILEIENITSEALAQELLRQYSAELGQRGILARLRSVQVRVEETPGQGASASR